MLLSYALSPRYWTVAHAVPLIISYLVNALKWGLHECCLISSGNLVSLKKSGHECISELSWSVLILCESCFNWPFLDLLIHHWLGGTAKFTNILCHQMSKCRSYSEMELSYTKPSVRWRLNVLAILNLSHSCEKNRYIPHTSLLEINVKMSKTCHVVRITPELPSLQFWAMPPPL